MSEPVRKDAVSEWTLDWDAIAKRIEKWLGGLVTIKPFGPDGVVLRQAKGWERSVIVTCADFDGVDWVHASIASPHRLPSYMDLTLLHGSVWGSEGFAYQVFASSDRHISIHNNALHLWGRSDGLNVLPDFGSEGTI